MTATARRILLLVPSMHLPGGTERVVHNLSSLFTAQGAEVAIASFDEDVASWHFQGEGKRFALGSIGRWPLSLRWIEYLIQANKLASCKRGFRPDVTISNLWRADLVSLLAGANDRKIALAHINVVGNPTNRLMIRLRALVGLAYRRFDRVVAVSRPLAAELGELYRLRSGTCVAIDNFTDLPQATKCLPDDGVRRAVWCGRLVYEKNLAGLLEVWGQICAKMERVQLLVLGDGPLRGELEANARKLGLRCGSDPAEQEAQIVFMGNVLRPADYQLSARVLVISSLAEGLPMVLLEALALGVPVLAADCPSGGVKAALTDTEAEATGLGAILPIPRPGDLASQARWVPWLTTALTDDTELERWQNAARARSERFSAKRAAASWQATIDAVLA